MSQRKAHMGVRWYDAAFLLVAACSPSSLVELTPPSTVVDPSTVTTPAGAVQLYNNAIGRFAVRLGGGFNTVNLGSRSYVVMNGLITDELMGASAFTYGTVDERRGSECLTDISLNCAGEGDNGSIGGVYSFQNQVRVEAQQARQALQLYAPGTAALQARMYALEAYSILYLAEAFCSGVPLTAVPLVGPQIVTRGFTTQELFQRAAAMFDSAIALTADSSRFVTLAKIGKGRALLNLGKAADAATAVQGVPTTFVYNAEFSISVSDGSNEIGGAPQSVMVVDREGTNGLVWSNDPRAAITTVPALAGAMPMTAKYSVTAAGTLDASTSAPSTPIRVADGLEARLIEAEADLAAGGSNWLSILNTLRATCIGTAACAPLPGLTAAALPPLVDPGTTATRLDLLMRERALWLFLTGHRQGDLRRMARVYHRDVNTLFPTGIYLNPGYPPNITASQFSGQPYGSDVVMIVPPSEKTRNPLYGGCYEVAP